MRLLILLYFVTTGGGTRAQQMSTGSVAQTATCAVAAVTGNVTLNCPGLDPAVVRILNEQFKARLKDRDLRVEQLTREANDWKDKFVALTTRLADAGVNDGQRRKAEDLLKAGKFEEAGRVLDEVLAGGEKEIDEVAKSQFERATLYELQFQPLQALPHYEKAYNYRSKNPNYGRAYADLLYRQRDFVKAESVYQEVLQAYRELAKANPQAYLQDVAGTLNNLGILYRATQRLEESRDAYTEALQAYRELAKANPQAYLPYVAGTLNNLGNLYYVTQRLKESGGAYTEALQIQRKLAKANPQAYLPHVATTLNNLGILYRDTQRLKESGDAYTEALQIQRKLAKANPQAYLPEVATTLNNLGVLYLRTQRLKESGGAYTEALQIRQELAKANPQAYLPDVATTLSNLGNLYKAERRDKEAADVCDEARAIYKQLAADSPAKFGQRPDFACTVR